MPRLRKTIRLDVKDEDPNVYNPGVDSNSRRAYMPAYIARDLGYDKEVIDACRKAKSEEEATRILCTARKNGGHLCRH